MMSKKLLNDSFWSLFGNILSKGLALIAGVIVARYLGKDLFGEYSLLKNSVVVIAVFSTFGLGYTSTKIVAELKSQNSFLLSHFIYTFKIITLVFGGIVTFLVFVFSDFISLSFFGTGSLSVMLKYVALLILVNSMISVYLGVLSGLGVFKQIAKCDILSGVISFVLTVLFTYKIGIEGAILALIITQLINLILYDYLLRKTETGQTKNKLKRDTFIEVLTLSTPIALQEGVYSLSQWLISILLLRYANFGEVGMFTAAMQWNAMVLFIPGVLRNVVLSNLSNNVNDKSTHSKILKQILYLTFIVVLACVVFVFIFSDFINSFYGNSFTGLKKVINLAMISTIFSSLSNVYAQAYMSKGMNWTMFLFRAIRDIGTIVFFLLIILFDDSEPVLSMMYSILIISGLFYFIMMIYYKLKY